VSRIAIVNFDKLAVVDFKTCNAAECTATLGWVVGKFSAGCGRVKHPYRQLVTYQDRIPALSSGSNLQHHFCHSGHDGLVGLSPTGGCWVAEVKPEVGSKQDSSRFHDLALEEVVGLNQAVVYGGLEAQQLSEGLR